MTSSRRLASGSQAGVDSPRKHAGSAALREAAQMRRARMGGGENARACAGDAALTAPMAAVSIDTACPTAGTKAVEASSWAGALVTEPPQHWPGRLDTFVPPGTAPAGWPQPPSAVPGPAPVLASAAMHRQRPAAVTSTITATKAAPMRTARTRAVSCRRSSWANQRSMACPADWRASPVPVCSPRPSRPSRMFCP